MPIYQLSKKQKLVMRGDEPLEVNAERPSDAQAWFREHWPEYKKAPSAFGIQVKSYHSCDAFKLHPGKSAYTMPRCSATPLITMS